MTSKRTTRDSVIIIPTRSEKEGPPHAKEEEGYRGIFENAVIGIFKSTLDGRPIEVNPAAANMFGYGSPEEMVTTVTNASMLYESPETRHTIIKAAMQNGGRLLRWEERLRRRDGSTFRASLNIRIILDEEGLPHHLEGFIEDVTDQKMMQEAIKESEGKFRGIYEESPIGFCIFDGLGRLIGSNQSCLTIFGVSNISEVIGSRLFDVPYMDEKAKQRLNAGITIRKDVEFDFEDITKRNIFKSAKKGRAYLDVSIKPLGVEDDKPPTGYLMQVQDITDRKRMDEDLLHIQRQQKAILDNIPDIAWLKDRESRFIQVNEPFGKACGIQPNHLVGKTDLDIWPHELAQRYRADDGEVMASGRRKMVEEPLADREGRISWIETIKTPIFNDRGEVIGTTGIARDITQRKRSQEAFDKMKGELEDKVAKLTEELEETKKPRRAETDPKQTTLG